MKTDIQSKPPFDIEQALDLIIGGAAHTSETEAHSEFGLKLLEEYFSKLRDNYKNDPVSSRYLNNLFAVIASAVRGFSVERTRFSRRQRSIEATKREQIEHINRITSYTSVNEKGLLWKLFGTASFVMFILKNFTDRIPIKGLLLLGLAVGFIGLDCLLSWIRKWRTNKITSGIFDKIDQEWKKSLLKYRDILRNFLILAIKVREEFYPHLNTIDGEKFYHKYKIACIDFGETMSAERIEDLDELNAKLDEIIEKHFAFKPLDNK